MEQGSPTSLSTTFDPNSFYRITSLAFGSNLSFDISVPGTGAFNGSTSLWASGASTGQLWQVLESNTTGHFFLSSSLSGAKRKLDVLANARGDNAPFLKSFALEGMQTWALTPQVDLLSGIAWTWSPDSITGGNGQRLAVTVYNDTRQPFLSPLVPDTLPEFRRRRQLWSFTLAGRSINDSSFSSTNLPALATQPPWPPSGVITSPATSQTTSTTKPAMSSSSSTSSTTTTTTTTSSSSTSTSTTPALVIPTVTVAPSTITLDSSQLMGPLVAAAIVPSTVLVVALAAIAAFIYSRRRPQPRPGSGEEPEPGFLAGSGGGSSSSRPPQRMYRNLPSRMGGPGFRPVSEMVYTPAMAAAVNDDDDDDDETGVYKAQSKSRQAGQGVWPLGGGRRQQRQRQQQQQQQTSDRGSLRSLNTASVVFGSVLADPLTAPTTPAPLRLFPRTYDDDDRFYQRRSRVWAERPGDDEGLSPRTRM